MKSDEISVNVTEIILTPLTTAVLVNEILKNLIYQKSQIPYSFSWLENAVKRKRNSTQNSENKSINLNVEKCYKLASAAYDGLENLMKHIESEFLTFKDMIKEVLILFGSTPLCAKEVFIVKIPFINIDHVEDNHLHNVQKYKHKVLREIFLSDKWTRAMETSVPSTNTFVLLKKLKRNGSQSYSDFFICKKNYSLPQKTKCCVIELNTNKPIINSYCSHISIHCDSEMSKSEEILKSNREDQLSNCMQESMEEWYQADLAVKGFKDLFINRVSASELW